MDDPQQKIYDNVARGASRRRGGLGFSSGPPEDNQPRKRRRRMWDSGPTSAPSTPTNPAPVPSINPNDSVATAKARALEIAQKLAAKAGNIGGAVHSPHSRQKIEKKVFVPANQFPEKNFIGLLIGPRGSTQKRMEQESGAKIYIRGQGTNRNGNSYDDEPLHVMIVGESNDCVAKAEQLVKEILFDESKASSLKSRQLNDLAGRGGGHYGGGRGGGDGGIQDEIFYIPDHMAGKVIGRGGETIKELQASTGCKVQIAQSDGTPKREVKCSGPPEALKIVRERIEQLTMPTSGGRGGMRGGGGHSKQSIKLPVPGDKVGLVIGRGGATIKRLQGDTRTRIQISPMNEPDDPNTRIITVLGDSLRDCEEAQRQIYDVLKQDMERKRDRSQHSRGPPTGGRHYGGNNGGYGQSPRNGGQNAGNIHQPAAYDPTAYNPYQQQYAYNPYQQQQQHGYYGMYGAQPPVPGSGQPPLPGQQPPLPGQQPPLPGQQPPLPGQQPPLPGQQPPLPGQQPPLPGQQPPLPGQQPPLPGQQPPMPGQQPPPPVPGQQQPMPGQQPYSIPQPPVPGQQPAVHGQPPVPMGAAPQPPLPPQ